MNLALVVLAVVAIVIVEVAYPYFFMYWPAQPTDPQD